MTELQYLQKSLMTVSVFGGTVLTYVKLPFSIGGCNESGSLLVLVQIIEPQRESQRATVDY